MLHGWLCPKTRLECEFALFGSMARNVTAEASNVDRQVEFNRPTGLFGPFALQDDLEELLGRHTSTRKRHARVLGFESISA